jgi:hypothetical protein
MLTFVKNKLGQVSLVAAETFKKDEVVFDLDLGEYFETPNLRTIELDPNHHVDNPYGRYTNHNCNPTCYVDKYNKVMRAIRDIKLGEEVNFNYLENETNISTSFNCKCGAENCVKFIGTENSNPTYLDIPLPF